MNERQNLRIGRTLMEMTIANHIVRIDRDQCIGSGNCVKVAPQIFEIDEDNLVRFREEIGSITAEQLIEACDVCPVDALSVIDATGQQIVPRS